MPFCKDFLIVFIIKICFSSNFKINPSCLYTIVYIWGNIKVKVKLSLHLLKHKTMKAYGGMEV